METAEEFATKLVARVWDRMRLDWGAVRQYEEATKEVEADRAAVALAAKREAFEQVARELTSWAAQHVDAGHPGLEKTLLVAAQTYADKAKYAAKAGGGATSPADAPREPA